MRILRWLAGAIGVVVLSLVALVIGARFGDGPLAIIPGGPLEAGELVTGAEPDWTFARDIAEMEFQLVEPPRSRVTKPNAITACAPPRASRDRQRRHSNGFASKWTSGCEISRGARASRSPSPPT